MGFFDEVDLELQPPSRLRPQRPPWWMAPPPGCVPGVVEARLLLARTADLAFAVRPLLAYPNGLELTLHLYMDDEYEYDPSLHTELGGGPFAQVDPHKLLRFGVDYGDGRKAVSVGGHHHIRPSLPWDPQDPNKAPTEPVLSHRSGSGSGPDWSQSYWLHPLPEGPTLAFVIEWAHRGIPERRAEVDTSLILAAAERSWSVWGP